MFKKNRWNAYPDNTGALEFDFLLFKDIPLGLNLSGGFLNHSIIVIATPLKPFELLLDT